MGQDLLVPAKSGTVTEAFTAIGAGSWTVPDGVTGVEVLLVAGGGSTLNQQSITAPVGGASGGQAIRRRLLVSPGAVVPFYVGAGGAAITNPVNATTTPGTNGENSTFGSLTAVGGRAPLGIIGANSVGPGSGAGGTSGGPGGSGLDGFGGGGGSAYPGTPPLIGAGGGGASGGSIVNANLLTLPSGAPNSGAGAPGFYSTQTGFMVTGGGGGSGIVILTYTRGG